MRRITFLIVAAALAVAAAVQAGETDATKTAHHKMAMKEKPVVMPAADIKWADAPPALPAGAKLAVLAGNPNGWGYYTFRLQVPDGYKFMPHWHPTTENVTVLSGELHAAMGDKFDENGAATIPAGGFASIPPRMHHFAWTVGETTLQISGKGPFKLIYVNPADDPSGMQGKTKAAAKKVTKKTGA